MLCTWARDRGIRGIGVDMSALFSEQAKLRAEELGVADRVTFIHQDAAGYVAEENATSPPAWARPGSPAASPGLSSC
jgi:23S rRNA G2445 N2-methylase RlmL